jgi:hypothetical protein
VPRRVEVERVDRAGGLVEFRWLGAAVADVLARKDLWNEAWPTLGDGFMVVDGYELLVPALLGLVWRLSAGLERYALPVWDGAALFAQAGLPCQEIGLGVRHRCRRATLGSARRWLSASRRRARPGRTLAGARSRRTDRWLAG